MHFTEFNMV